MKKHLFQLVFIFLFVVAGVAAHYGSTSDGVSIVTLPEPPIANQVTFIEVGLYDQSVPINRAQLDTVHERQMHVFIVGSDLQTFAHIHPEDFAEGFAKQEQGAYLLQHTFPAAGPYVIVVDYTVAGEAFVGSVPISVSGSDVLPAVAFDFNTTKQFGAYNVQLEQPDTIVPGEETEFTYIIEKAGSPVRNLELYLGSEIHMLAIRDTLTNAGHTHAYSEHAGHHEAMQMYTGPSVPVRYTFTEPGVYALFGQFKAGEDIVTTQFMVKVEEPSTESATRSPLLFMIGAVLIVLIVVAVIFGRKRRKR